LISWKYASFEGNTHYPYLIPGGGLLLLRLKRKNSKIQISHQLIDKKEGLLGGLANGKIIILL